MAIEPEVCCSHLPRPPVKRDAAFVIATVAGWGRSRGPTLVVTFALAATVWFLQVQTWPYVGHDFSYFLPRLLDVHLHYLCAGPSIQWWTPSFGGGLPAFANPQHTQFMPAQWLVFFMEPWRAVVTANVALTSLGFLLVERFMREGLQCDRIGSIAAALVFASSGFELQHMLVGHVAFATWPLLAVLPFGFITDRPVLRRAALLGLTAAYLIYAGGYVVIACWALCAPVLIAVLSQLDPRRFVWQKMLAVFGSSLAAAVLASSVKLIAIAEWMTRFRHVIDDGPGSSLGRGFISVLSQLTLWRISVVARWLFGNHNFIHYARAQIWEWDVSVAPTTWLPLAGIAWVAFRRRNHELRWPDLRKYALVAAAASLLVGIFSSSSAITSIAHRLPLIRSLHCNWRLTSSVVLPIAILSGWGLSQLCRHLAPRTRRVILTVFVTTSFATLLPFEKLKYNEAYRSYDARIIEACWNATHHGEHFVPIRSVLRVRDDAVFAADCSSLLPYEPIFGYGIPGPEFHTQLVPGPIWRSAASNPNFNLPLRFLSAATTVRSAFTPAPRTESLRVAELLVRHQPDWPMGLKVRTAEFISIGTLLVLFIALAAPSFGRASPVTAPAVQSAVERDESAHRR